ncbi:MAG: SDR family NAD(P)-dependent oxidoreductase [Leptospira sp.]|nr:SDR family NAD(P)-dependent oxidoreductase [Leptospira sp.]
MKNTDNKNCALILGATSDIGREIAEELSSKNFDLILTGQNKDLLSQIHSDLLRTTKQDIKIQTHLLDITETDGLTSFVLSLDPLPNIVFCCIGYYKDQKIARVKPEEFTKTIQINFTGIATFLNLLTIRMEEIRSGKIVVISSVAGVRGRQLNYIYGSAKAGLTTYLSGLRNLLHKKNIRITTVLLGPVFTKMSAGHNLMPWITLQPKVAAKKIVQAGLKGKDEVYIHWIWQFIMAAIRMIPEGIFKRLPPF